MAREDRENQPHTDPAHPGPTPGTEEQPPAEFGDPGGAPAPEETGPQPGSGQPAGQE